MTRLETRANQGIRKNDVVRVLSGRETGKTGKVLEIVRKNNSVIVEKLNMVKRHQRPNQQYRQGGIIEKEAPLHLSKVALVTRGTIHIKEEKAEKAKKETKKS